MAGLETLSAVVRREVAAYASLSPNSKAYFVVDEAGQVFAVVVVPSQNPQKATVMILARIAGTAVIIETDKMDRPLYEALTRAGIPREQIILATSGAPTPTS